MRPAGSAGRHGRGGEDEAVQEPAAHEGEAGGGGGGPGSGEGRRRGGSLRPGPRWGEERRGRPGSAKGAPGAAPAAARRREAAPGVGGWSRRRGREGPSRAVKRGGLRVNEAFSGGPSPVCGLFRVYAWPRSVCPGLAGGHGCLLPPVTQVLKYKSIYLHLRSPFQSGVELCGLLPGNLAGRRRFQSGVTEYREVSGGGEGGGGCCKRVPEGLVQESSFMVAAEVSPQQELTSGHHLRAFLFPAGVSAVRLLIMNENGKTSSPTTHTHTRHN